MTVEEMGQSVLAQVGARFDGVTLLLVEIRDQVRSQNGRVATLERAAGNIDGRLGDVADRVRIIAADGHHGRNRAQELHGQMSTQLESHDCRLRVLEEDIKAPRSTSTESTVLTIGLVRWVSAAIVGTVAAMLGLLKMIGKL